jgi:hypothetical protein
MTSNNTRVLELKFGLHASVADFTTAPSTLRVIQPESHTLWPRDTRRLDRNLASPDNRAFAGLIGPQDLAPFQVVQLFRGVSANSDGGAFDVSASMEQADMLDVIFGTAAADIAGAAVTVAASGHTPASGIIAVSSTTVATGDMILFSVTSGADFVAREVASGGGTITLTCDRAYVGTPTTGSTVVRAARWNHDPSVSDRVHGGFTMEWEDGIHSALGCMAESMELSFAEGEIVRMTTSWVPTSFSPGTDGALSFTAPPFGSEVVAVNSALWIAGVEFLPSQLSLRIGNSLRPRATPAGANGVLGYMVRNVDDVVISGLIYAGSNSGSLGEMQYDGGTPSFRDLTESNTARDIAIQVGLSAGAALYLRIPAADVRMKAEDVDGALMWRFEAIARKPATGSACRLGVF